jgi:hypothetical protein
MASDKKLTKADEGKKNLFDPTVVNQERRQKEGYRC